MSDDFKPDTIRVERVVGRVVAAATENYGATELRIAVGHGYRPKDGGDWKQTGTSWINVVAVGSYGDALKEFNKGERVEVTGGSLETRNWDKDDGTKGSAVSLRYGTVELLEAAREKSDGFVPAGATGF